MIPAGHVRVHWLDLSSRESALLPVSNADSALSPAERERAAAFRFDLHRDRFLRRRIALRRILAAELDVAPEDIDYAVNDHDRPYLAAHPELHFSASSSGDVGVVAVSAHELGADVERLVAGDRDRDVARRLFAPEEVAVLDAAPDEEFVALFFACWTRKEAYVKATGLGLSFPLASFAIELGDVAAPRLLRSDLRPGDRAARSIRRLVVPLLHGGDQTRATAALVVDHPDPVVTSSPHDPTPTGAGPA